MNRMLKLALLLLLSVAICRNAGAQAPPPAMAPPPAGQTGAQASPPAGPPGMPGTPEQRAAMMKAHDEQMKNDWAFLARYHDANAAISGPVKAVFMGDSITELWARDPATFFPGENYVGRGISGQTTPQMLVRFQQDVVDLKPRVVVINAGTNDIAGNTGPSTLQMIEDNLKSMTEIAQANNIKVVLASVTPAYDYPWRPGLEPAEKVVALNAWIKQFCSQGGGCVYADYFTPMSDEKHAMKDGLSRDGIHPTPAGFAIMAPIAEAAISKALAQ
jgi:acyl-CoA thioesterase I